MRKNGIAYPLAPEVIAEIEKQRKKFAKNVGVKVSQARFSSIIAPRLRHYFKNTQIKPQKISKKKRRRRRWS